jgi:hypothetical protein
MEWRCEWCGKPHENDDPPCDNCGHGTFERAVVREAPTGGSDAATTSVWVCQECGRAHPKNSPPCSRCGHATLELEERTLDDYEDIGAPGYRDLITTRYAVGLVAALALGAVFVLGVTGIVTIPGLSPAPLTVEDVPGNGSVAGGVDLEAAEEAYLEALNDRRRDAGVAPLSRDGTVSDVTRFLNQVSVKERLTDDDLPSSDDALDRLRGACPDQPEQPWQPPGGQFQSIGSYETADGLANDLAGQSPFATASLERSSAGKTGIDVHVGPDGTVYVLQVVC